MAKSSGSKFTLTPDFLARSLKFLRGLAPSETIRFLSMDGRVLSIESVTPSAFVSIEARTATLSGACDFSVNADAFTKAVKGAKDDYEFTYSDDDGSLNIRTGRTQITLQVVDGLTNDMPECDADWYDLEGDEADWLSQAIKKVALKPLAALNAHMQGVVHLSSKGATVACVDDSRMSFVTNKDLKGSLELSLPISTLQPVFDVFAKTNFSIAATESALFMKSKLVRAMLTLPDTGAAGVIDASEVLENIAHMRTNAKDCAQVNINRAECITFLENTQAVATKERLALDVKLSKGEGKLQVKTAAGAATTVLEATGNASFSVDLSFFEEAMSRTESAALLIGEGYLMLVGEPNIVISLNG